MQRLRSTLGRIDGRGYPAYKDIRGRYRFERFEVDVAHVQGDPFASPSRIAVIVPLDQTPVEDEIVRSDSRRVGVEDALLRSFAGALGNAGRRRGSGKSGQWGVARPSQEMLPRTACEIRGDELWIRLTVGLPARGRRVLGRQAEAMFFDELPGAVERGVFRADPRRLRAHAEANEDQEALRDMLAPNGWIAFIANGAVLPRRSGVDDRPMERGAVPWASPPALEVEVDLPNGGPIRGTGLRRGVTLICGGGYHGKSTLLQALSRSVFNHKPGDGRERCVTAYEAVNVRAEDGRRVCAVDISGFISGLPDGRDTRRFDTENASGSTSQAANIVEALELGATCLLIDEDTSATNFMVRDRRMQELITADREPITPFVDRVRGLADDLGVSTVLVVGGSGDYFDVADHVLVMDAFVPRLATESAKAIARRYPSDRLQEQRPALAVPEPRIPRPEGFDPSRGRKAERVRAQKTRAIDFGTEEIDIGLLAQIVDAGQARTIGDWLLRCSRGLADGRRSLREICEQMEAASATEGLSTTTAPNFGDRVMTRRFELGAAINRLRSLAVRRR